MDLKSQNVLMFERSMSLGGSCKVVLQLCRILKPYVNKIVVCSNGGGNVEKLESMGIAHYMIPDISNVSLPNVISTSKLVFKIIKEEKINVIHTHHRMAAFYVRLLHLHNKCRFLHTSHNTFYDKKLFTRYSLQKANIIACGAMVKKNLVEYYGLPEKQVVVVHNAVEPFEEEIVTDKILKSIHDDGNFIVGNVGRLSQQKGFEYFLAAVPNIISHMDNVRFVIIGSGEKEKELKTICKKINIEKYVVFLGYRSDIQNLMSQMDLIVLSSLWEGFPLTPIEAFSVGKTIVATAVDGTV